MEIKCPGCGAALVFDAQTGKMQCKYCGSFFTMADIEDQFQKVEQDGVQEPETPIADEPNTVQCNIYACTSCGAELAVNGVESSTFCAYCGQPTIVFSRVSQTLKPEVIIPFRIQKQEAVAAIRKRFNQGFFIPKEVKAFEVDRVHGIYIPHWLFDSYYYDKQLIRGTVGSGKYSRTMYFMREADCRLHNVPLDASMNLDDESSQRLEPYDMRDLRKFEIGYLSGYYSDRYDVSNKDLHELAAKRAMELFDSQMLESCSARSKEIIANKPRISLLKETYALLPAWFMTFRYKDKPYTMLVNGQTGKVVGAVPCDSAKVKLMASLIFLLTSLVSVPLGIYFCLGTSATEKSFFEMLIGIIFAMISMYYAGLKKLEKLQKSETLTASQGMNRYAHERQGEGGDFR